MLWPGFDFELPVFEVNTTVEFHIAVRMKLMTWVMDGEESEIVYDGWLQGEESVDEVEYEEINREGGEEVNVVRRDEDESCDEGEKYGSDLTDETARHDLTDVDLTANCKRWEEDGERMEQHNAG